MLAGGSGKLGHNVHAIYLQQNDAVVMHGLRISILSTHLVIERSPLQITTNTMRSPEQQARHLALKTTNTQR